MAAAVIVAAATAVPAIAAGRSITSAPAASIMDPPLDLGLALAIPSTATVIRAITATAATVTRVTTAPVLMTPGTTQERATRRILTSVFLITPAFNPVTQFLPHPRWRRPTTR